MSAISPKFQSLEALMQAYGPVGQEDEVREVCQELLKEVVDKLWTDPAGNLVAQLTAQNPTKSPLRILVHMDEIAMIVKKIHEDGSLRVNALGWLSPAALGQGPVEVLGDHQSCMAIVSHGCIHTTQENPTTHKTLPKEYRGEGKTPFWNDVYVTTRKTPEELSEQGIHPGTRVVIPKFRRQLVSIHDCIAGYYLDNRGAIYLAIESLKQLAGHALSRDIYFVATTREEIGGHGASYACRTLPGDLTIAIDVGPVSKEYGTSLSPDPLIVYQDSASTYDKSLSDALIQAGRVANLTPRHVLFEHYSSDASLSQTRGQAGQVALLAFAVDNTHGYEITHKDSFEQCSKLLTQAIVSDLLI